MRMSNQLLRISRRLLAASSIATLLGGTAMAQTVRVFDEAPPMDVLRGIMIPESVPGTARSIVMQRRDAAMTGIQRTSVTVTTPAMAPAATMAPAAAMAPRDTVTPEAVNAPVASAPTPPVSAPQPAPAPQQAAKPGTVGLRINFAFNSADLPRSAYDMIDRVAEVMKEAPDIKVRVEGHTDAVGGSGYNVTLSERRAVSVAEYLVKCGIDPARLILMGKGMTEPLTANPYDAANRRVQFVRVG